MKRTLNYLDEETYFQYFERKYSDPVFQEKYPLISERMKELCEKMKETINTSSPMHFLKCMRKSWDWMPNYTSLCL